MLPFATLNANGRSGLVNSHRSGTHTERPVTRSWSASADPLPSFMREEGERRLCDVSEPFKGRASNAGPREMRSVASYDLRQHIQSSWVRVLKQSRLIAPVRLSGNAFVIAPIRTRKKGSSNRRTIFAMSKPQRAREFWLFFHFYSGFFSLLPQARQCWTTTGNYNSTQEVLEPD